MTEQNSPGAVGQELASAIAISIETNPNTWTRPWSVTGEATPHNPITHEIYRGVNRLLLSNAAYAEAHKVGAWATKRDWRRAGIDVEPDRPGIAIVVPSETTCWDDPACDDGCGKATIRGFRTSTVFHYTATGSDQPPATHPRFQTAPPAFTADQISEMFAGLGAAIETGAQPYYSLTTDRITIPTSDMTAGLDHWVSTLAREHIHWTGHPSRLNRQVRKATSRQQALQQLVGEFGGLLLTNSLGLHYHPGQENQSTRHAWVSQLQGSTGGRVISETVASACAAAQMIRNGLNPIPQTSRHQPTATEPTSDHEPSNPPAPKAGRPKTKRPRRRRRRVRVFTRKTHSSPPLTTPTEPKPEPVTEMASAATAPDEESNDHDRRTVAWWIMERVAADNGDDETASQTIADLLDLPAEHCQRPPSAVPGHASREERLRVAKWMLEQVIADNDDPTEGAHHIGRLLGIAPREIQPPQNDQAMHL